MSFSTRIRRGLAMFLAIVLLVPFIPYPGDLTAAAAAVTERQTLNFNREWKFMRSGLNDTEAGAQAADYDDSSWFHVGLPHDFSIPYWQETSHYVGYGWYRKTFEIKPEWATSQISLDFEGVFHTAEVYVNGNFVGSHEGGYTGFYIDITDHVSEGENVVAIRVDNRWKADMAPRTGDHQFTGGIYRDVNMVITNPVHVAWYGTFVQTPDLEQDYTSGQKAKVRMQTEVKNDSNTAQTVKVVNTVYDADGTEVIKIEPAAKSMAPGEIFNFDATSGYINNPRLWSPAHLWDVEYGPNYNENSNRYDYTDKYKAGDPYLYKVKTEVYCNNNLVDQYEDPLGFRWVKWDKDNGFFLNGEHVWLDGVNAHQDHAGWSNAVTKKALYRDAAMIKDAGLNFIRGSHYAHSPAYSAACDELGVLLWSESDFWGMGSGEKSGLRGNGNSDDYKCDAYPINTEYRAAFEESAITHLEEMVRIHRNHPSVIIWSMGNEVFAPQNDANGTAAYKKALVSKMAQRCKELDPTRATAMGGAQRLGFDEIEYVDVAGYNGDGATKTSNPDCRHHRVPNMVAEYGSPTENRPGTYGANFSGNWDGTGNNVPMQMPGYKPEKPKWRSGNALWCAFHHGTIAGKNLADMGFIDYYRLPLNSWYFYRNYRLGIPREQSQSGTPAKLSLEASQTTIKNDGTDDAHIIVTVEDADGNWLNSTMEVTLEVVSGPGVFPTGKKMVFKPNDSIRDGKAAIEFRSHYAGNTVIKATSSTGLQSEPLVITTTGDPADKEPNINTMYGDFMVGTGGAGNPVEDPTAYADMTGAFAWYHQASSGEGSIINTLDGKYDTEWKASVPGPGQWLRYYKEHVPIFLYKVKLVFKDQSKAYPYKLQYKGNSGSDWTTLAEYNTDTMLTRPYEESFPGIYVEDFRIEFTGVPAGQYANLAQIEFYGLDAVSVGQAYTADSVYLSDLTWKSAVSAGGEPQKDKSAGNHAIKVGGNTYGKGLGVIAPSDIKYDLGANYTRFQCVVGVDAEVSGTPDAAVQVYGDDQLLYEKVLKTAGAFDTIDISVNQVNELSLRVTQPSANSNNHIDWADAKLLGAIRDISLAEGEFKAQYTEETQTLVPGQDYKVQAALERKTAGSSRLTAALTLYTKDGEVMATDMEKITAYGLIKTSLDLKVSVPADTPAGSYTKFTVWKTDELIPVVQTVYASAINDAAQPGSGKISPASMLPRAEGAAQTLIGNVMWADDPAVDHTTKGGSGSAVAENNGTIRADKYDPYTIGWFFPEPYPIGNITDKVRINALDNPASFSPQYTGYVTLTADAPKTGDYILNILVTGDTSRLFEVTVNEVPKGTTRLLANGATDRYTAAPNNNLALDVLQHTIPLNKGTNKIKLQAPLGYDGPNFIAAAIAYEGVDFNALNAAIAQYSTFKQDEFVSGWAAFAAALSHANTVGQNADASQNEVDAALDALLEAVGGLVRDRNESPLKKAIADALDIIYPGDADKYASKSRLGFTDTLYDGHLALADKLQDQAVVDKAAGDIREAIARLGGPAPEILGHKKAGAKIETVTLNVVNPDNTVLYLASYAEDGKMINIKSFIPSKADEQTIQVDLYIGEAKRVRAFLWDKNFMPLIPAYEISLGETDTFKQFMDFFRATPLTGFLDENCWGAKTTPEFYRTGSIGAITDPAMTVGARDQSNGLEDKTLADWDYWDGCILKGEDGKYHMFGSRWDKNAGHEYGWQNLSKAVHATSDNLYGPYTDQGLCYPDIRGGEGHNINVIKLGPNDSSGYKYGLTTSGNKCGSGKCYGANDLNGPWHELGDMTVNANGFTGFSIHNNFKPFTLPDGTYIAITSTFHVAKAQNIKGPWVVQTNSLFSQLRGSATNSMEDPLIFYSNGLYHAVFNQWRTMKASWYISRDGINWETQPGYAYDSYSNIVFYGDGAGNVTHINHWSKMERPFVYMEDGVPAAVTLAVIDSKKTEDAGPGDGHGSKIIVAPFDGEAFNEYAASVMESKTYTATADAYVNAANTNQASNYGTANTITVQQDPNGGDLFGETISGNQGKNAKIGYLKFDLSDVDPSKVKRAVLTLVYKNETGVNGADTIKVVSASPGWEESAITWNNKPSLNTSEIAESPTINLYNDSNLNGQYQLIAVDLGKLVLEQLVAGRTSVSFAFCETTGRQINFISKEGSALNAPHLTLTMDD